MALDVSQEAKPHSVGSLLPASTSSLESSPRATPRRAGPRLEVGFWADPRDPQDSRPVPSRLVDKEWSKTVAARAVELYARSGFLESFELGYSFCRLGCGGGEGGDFSASCDSHDNENKFMGCCTLTDGKYVWPEGLAHYISEHSLRPPEDFISRALGNLRAIRAAQAAGRLRWNAEDGRGMLVPLAPGTAAFLRDNSTLGIALPPEPETKGRASTEGVCSCMQS